MKIERKPYERKRNETDREWRLFVIYRDLDDFDRTLEKAAEYAGADVEELELLYKKRGWRKRIDSWTVVQDRARRRATLKQIEAARERQILLGVNLQKVGGAALQKLADMLRQEPDATISTANVIKLIREGAALERVNLGEPETIIEERKGPDVDLSKLSLKQLRELREIKKGLGDEDED
jgi:hypothetical protein